VKLAGLQFAARPGDVEGNLARLRAAAGEAAAQGAQLLVAPELAVTGYGASPETLRGAAAALDGAIPDALAGIARESGVALVAGFPERRGEAIHNSALFTTGRPAAPTPRPISGASTSAPSSRPARRGRRPSSMPASRSAS
jgi:predicted amidohydrolase